MQRYNTVIGAAGAATDGSPARSRAARTKSGYPGLRAPESPLVLKHDGYAGITGRDGGAVILTGPVGTMTGAHRGSPAWNAGRGSGCPERSDGLTSRSERASRLAIHQDDARC